MHSNWSFCVSAHQMRILLREKCDEVGGQTAWARANQFSPSYVCDVLQGRRDVSVEMAAALGFTRTVIYVPQIHVPEDD